ncbi:MAG: hypothetical protein MJA31_04855 [Clostridia bacterium]|nr:hypothetical protein [Clostridia bacterium]
MEKPNIRIGETNTTQKIVESHDTAANYGTGDLETLFATPSLVAMMLDASVHLVDKKLPEGFISVGKMAMATHEKTTILGETVTVEVKIAEFNGTKITFEMTAYDEIGVIGHGKHERIIVNKKKLLERAAKRAQKLKNLDY